MAIDYKEKLNEVLGTLAQSGLDVLNTIRTGDRREIIRKEMEYASRFFEDLAIKAAADSLGIDASQGLSTKTINDIINKKLEGSGLKVTDIFNKSKTKADIKKFATKKMNEALPSGLKFRSMSRQDMERGVKNYMKRELAKMAKENAAELALDDDTEVLAMIEAYNDGRGIPTGDDDDPTNSERQATFRAGHSYYWQGK